MKKIFIITILASLFACSSIRVAYDYDKQIDFAKYKTFKFTQDELTTSIGQLNRDRLLKAVEDEMIKKGFTKADNADLYVDVFVKSEKKVDVTATTTGGYGGYGPYRYGYGGGFTTTDVNYNEYTEGTLFITLVDVATEKIVWQGTGTKTLNEGASPEQREKNITYAVSQILFNYPPKK